MAFEDGYEIRNQSGVHFVTFAVVDWVDVFSRKIYRDIIIDNLEYYKRERGMRLYAWCLMSNHLHMIYGAKDGNSSDLLRDFKTITSKRIIKAIKANPGESRREWMLERFEKAGAANKRNTSAC